MSSVSRKFDIFSILSQEVKNGDRVPFLTPLLDGSDRGKKSVVSIFLRKLRAGFTLSEFLPSSIYNTSMACLSSSGSGILLVVALGAGKNVLGLI